MKQIEVAAAIFHRGREILAMQKGYGPFKGFWEFPGGKLEKGELPTAALIREIREELDADICIERHFMTADYDYPDFHITLHCYFCSLSSGSITMLEHTGMRWLAPEQFEAVKWLPADLAIVRAIQAEALR